MRSSLLIVALCVMAAAREATCFAQATPAPPDWQDQIETSVYDGIKQQAVASQTIAPPIADPATHATPSGVSAPQSALPSESVMPASAPTEVSDSDIVPATHQEPAPVATAPTADPRRLAPPRNARVRLANRASADGSPSGPALADRFSSFGLPTDTIFKMVSALGVVIGGFLIFAWLLRRGSRRSGAMLPTEVVSVLGRVPLAGRQFAELLRVGNKLVLVALTPGGAEPITEVTDPTEVDRLTGLCQQENPHSTTKAFEHVFQQLSRESAPGGFLGEPTLPTTLSAAAEAYRTHRGATARA